MVNPFKEIQWNPDRDQRRAFAWSLVIGFPCVGLLLLLAGYATGKGWNVPLALAVGGWGAGAGLVFLAVPAVSKPFYVAWYCVAACLGLVIGNLLLALVYYVLVFGIGLLLRAFGRQSIGKTVDRQASTYWRNVDHHNESGHYHRQF